MAERTFTPDEANAALAQVEPLVRDMVAAHARLERAREGQEQLAARIAGNGGGMPPSELAAAQEEVAAAAADVAKAIDAIHELGVQVKGIEEGLVDFPAILDGEEVLLCWRLGEPEVAYYHGYDDGFAGRRPL